MPLFHIYFNALTAVFVSLMLSLYPSHATKQWQNTSNPRNLYCTLWTMFIEHTPQIHLTKTFPFSKWVFQSLCTGSFRKNGKSKTVFMGIKFQEKLIFSAFFSRELATNLRCRATSSVTITLWHPENVAPPVWFQALVGCLKPTTDPETLSKDHKGVLWSVRPPLGILWLY